MVRRNFAGPERSDFQSGDEREKSDQTRDKDSQNTLLDERLQASFAIKHHRKIATDEHEKLHPEAMNRSQQNPKNRSRVQERHGAMKANPKEHGESSEGVHIVTPGDPAGDWALF